LHHYGDQFLPDYTAWHPRQKSFSYLEPWGLEISTSPLLPYVAPQGMWSVQLIPKDNEQVCSVGVACTMLTCLCCTLCVRATATWFEDRLFLILIIL
jgi:hypothetical protein